MSEEQTTVSIPRTLYESLLADVEILEDELAEVREELRRLKEETR